MENDIVDSLRDIGYEGSLTDVSHFNTVIGEGLLNEEFRLLIYTICGELKVLLRLDESVSQVTHEEDISGFIIEMCSLLKELGCPYKTLLQGPLTDRLATNQQRLLLLDFLLSELMAARMISVHRPSTAPELRLQESATAKDLKAILLALQFPRPPDNITVSTLFEKLKARLKEVLSRAPADLKGKPLLIGRLSDEQWKILNQVHSELQQEYRLRREMLLRRLDVTIQSFQWSDRAKGQENAIAQQFGEKRRHLEVEPSVSLADVLAARQDLAIIEKTSGTNARQNTQSSVNKVVIGKVPDRGGRPSEQEAPPPEMPSWKKDRAQGGGPGQGGSGGARGGGQFSRGGGRVQGNWNDNKKEYQDSKGDSSWYGHDSRGRGGHDGYDNRRGGYDNRSRGGGRDSYDNRGRGGGKDNYDNRNRGGGEDGYDNRNGGGFDSRDRGGRGAGRGRGRW